MRYLSFFRGLGVPITDHTFDDCRLMSTAAKLNFPAAAALVETNKLTSKLGSVVQVD